MAGIATKSFKGKVARHGGSRGIGAGIVRRLAADGASVAFTYSSSEEKAFGLVREIESAGGEALALRANGASAEELRTAVTKTADPRPTRYLCQQCRHPHPGHNRHLQSR